MLKVFLIALFSLLLCSCVTQPPKRLLVPLEGTNSATATVIKKNRLTVMVSNHLPNSENLGGSDGDRDVRFQNIIPWLKGQLASLGELGCLLHHPLQLKVSVDKLYASNTSQTIVANLVLIGRYRKNQNALTPAYYRGQCVVSFFAGNETRALQNCLNRAMQKIIPEMKADICRRSA